MNKLFLNNITYKKLKYLESFNFIKNIYKSNYFIEILLKYIVY
jgi:hypothetical protein